MNFSVTGPWIAVATSILMLARVVVVAIALRGSKPRDRPAIIHALAALYSPRHRGIRRGATDEVDSAQTALDS